MEPGTFTIEVTNSAAAYIDPGKSTCHTGNTVEWFIVSGGLAMSAESKVEHDTHIYAHYPVRLQKGGRLSQDMGQIINIPILFQGLTRTEARTKDPPAGYLQTIEDTLDEAWSRWNR
eukprot:12936129-Heterocapsa_arctica.AAC.1